MCLTNFGSRNRIKLIARRCYAQFPSYGPPSPNEAPHPQGMDPRAEPMYVRDMYVTSFNLRDYTFLCDYQFGSDGQIKFWANTLSVDLYRAIDARAHWGPAGAYFTAPRMTSKVMLSAFSTGSLSSCYPYASVTFALSARLTSHIIRVYLRACDVIICVYPRVIGIIYN